MVYPVNFHALNGKAGVIMMKTAQIAPLGKSHRRVSSESAWPLRNSQGITFAEAKRRRELNDTQGSKT